MRGSSLKHCFCTVGLHSSQPCDAEHYERHSAARGVPHTQHPINVKVLMVGRAWAGKTALVDRLTRRTFTPNVRLTLGVENTMYTYHTDTGECVEAYIWDVQGQENAGLLRPVYYRGAHAAIVTVDLDILNYTKSMAAAIEWKKDIDMRVRQPHDGTTPVPILLVGNKCDLDSRLNDTELNEFVSQHGFVGYMETSAKDGTNVIAMFHTVFQEALEVRKREIHALSTQSCGSRTIGKPIDDIMWAKSIAPLTGNQSDANGTIRLDEERSNSLCCRAS